MTGAMIFANLLFNSITYKYHLLEDFENSPSITSYLNNVRHYSPIIKCESKSWTYKLVDDLEEVKDKYGNTKFVPV